MTQNNDPQNVEKRQQSPEVTVTKKAENEIIIANTIFFLNIIFQQSLKATTNIGEKPAKK